MGNGATAAGSQHWSEAIWVLRPYAFPTSVSGWCCSWAMQATPGSRAVEVLQAGPRSRPFEGDQSAAHGEGGKGGAEILAAEADIGHHRIGQEVLIDPAAVRPDVTDGAGEGGGDADVARGIHRQGVDPLVPAEAREQMDPLSQEAGPGGEHTRSFHVIDPSPH